MIELKGLPLACDERSSIIDQVSDLKKNGIEPRLDIVLIGNDPGSVWYARSKESLGRKLGIKVMTHAFAYNATTQEIIEFIDQCNENNDIHGILIELPLPEHIRKFILFEWILPEKDVDGVCSVNRGRILSGNEESALLPATACACLNLIKQVCPDLKGKNVTLVGRGDTVGRPLAMMLVKRDTTVTICHTKTRDLKSACLNADVVISAAGKHKLIKSDMVTKKTVVIDAGISEIKEGVYAGDVDFDRVKGKVAALTPVPGGVGVLTTTLIFKNLMKAIHLQKKFSE